MLGEIYTLTAEIGIALKNIDKWMAPQYVHKDLPNKLNDAYILPEPLGVVLSLSAWNFPLLLTLGPLIGAIAAGKCHMASFTECCNWCVWLDVSAPSKQHARRVSAPEPRVTTDAESKQDRKPRRSWLPPFKGRSGQYNLISHDSPAIHGEKYKKKQSSNKLAKSLYEREDEEKEQEEAKPLPYDTTAAVDMSHIWCQWPREVTL